MKASFNKVFATPVYPTHLINRKIEIVTEDGLILRGWQVSPPSSSSQEPKGNIVIVHGFKDYSERYLEFAGELARNGYQVFAYDQRGHARSDGDRAYFPNFEVVTNDLQLALESFKKYDNKKPWIILGHSIGGSIAARFALTHDSEIAGLILSAPALKPMPELQGLIISALRAANIVAPHMGVIDLPDKDFSRDPDVVARMKEDELITKSKIPARSGFGALMNMEFVQENKSKAKVPFLILHGSDDHINNIEGSREFFEETPNIPGKDLKIYPSFYHDLLHEPEHEKVEKDILNWVNLISTRKHMSHSETRPHFS